MIQRLPKPPWAAYVWSDATHIHVEPPCPEGRAPYIASFARTEAGFAKALGLIEQCANKDKAPPPAGYYRHKEAKPRVTYAKPAAPVALAEATKRVLRKMGMV